MTDTRLEKLVPNPDHCNECEKESKRSFPLYASELWWEKGSGYIRAAYRCVNGHSWETSWAIDLMIHPDTLKTLIDEDGVIPPLEYRKP